MKDYRKYYLTSALPAGYRQSCNEMVIAYETYGELNREKDNGILVIHGFSSSSHVASHAPDDEEGWWEWLVGPGRVLDTERFYLVCANNLGSCFGTTGPATMNEKTGEPYGKDFLLPSVADIVRLQQVLQEGLGIPRWHAVMGGSLGGMAALEWAASFPEKTARAICLNAGAGLSHLGQGILGLQQDLLHAGGGLEPEGTGFQTARCLATLTYLGEEFYREKRRQAPEWSVMAFLKAEAVMFTKKYSPFSYLCFLHAMRQFDLEPSQTPLAVSGVRPEIFLAGCLEDLLFPPVVVEETMRRFAPYTRVNATIVSSRYGHDSFLLDEDLYQGIIKAALA